MKKQSDKNLNPDLIKDIKNMNLKIEKFVNF